MKFNSSKDLLSKIKTLTNEDDLKDDIILMSQGQEIVMEHEGIFKNNDKNEAFYMSKETTHSFRIKYKKINDTIEVLEVHLTK